MNEDTKKRGGNHGSPTVGDNGLTVQPGDLTNYISNMIELKRLPMPQTDEEIAERIDLYFRWCVERDMRPGIEGLSFALGISRKTLWDWEQGNTWGNSRRAEMVKMAKQGICMLTEQMGLKGKLNPVTYIFTMKNHFNYSDRSELDVSSGNNLFGESLTPEEIAKRIPADIDADYTETDTGLSAEEISKRIPQDLG